MFIVKVNRNIIFWSCHYWLMSKENDVQTLPTNVMVLIIFPDNIYFSLEFIYAFHPGFDPHATKCWRAWVSLRFKHRVATGYPRIHWAVLHLPSPHLQLWTTCNLELSLVQPTARRIMTLVYLVRFPLILLRKL